MRQKMSRPQVMSRPSTSRMRQQREDNQEILDAFGVTLRDPLPVSKDKDNAKDQCIDFGLATVDRLGPNLSTAHPADLMVSSSPQMCGILSDRLMKIKGGRPMYRDSDNAFVSYIMRLADDNHGNRDDSTIVSLLPIVVNSINCPDAHDGAPKPLSMGGALELIPILNNLLKSPYEDYIGISLDVIKSILKRWRTELQALASDQSSRGGLNSSRSLQGLYLGLVHMGKHIEKLTTRPSIGPKAGAVASLLANI